MYVRVYVLMCDCVIISSLSAHPPTPPQVWSHPAGWTPLKTLAGHVGKVMAVDVSKGE